jgi:hypothetical protein
MESSTQNRRFPPPWRVEKTDTVTSCRILRASRWRTFTAIHKSQWGDYTSHLTSDEARRIAKAMARIPEFLIRAPGFYSRQGGDKRWKSSSPYHVALQDWYVREQWDRINAICAYNGVPFDPTGERINRDGLWCVYGRRHHVLGQISGALDASRRFFLSGPTRGYSGYERPTEP